MDEVVKYIDKFKDYLISEERSENTIEKYLRDISVFGAYIKGRELSKVMVMEYKKKLLEGYAVTSANSMIAAVNAFLRFIGREDCRVKLYKVQRKTYCAEEKELTKAEYMRLVHTAQQKKDDRLALIMQTICATGIRVSELKYITLEAIKTGKAIINSKGKVRTIFIVRDLRKMLLQYAKKKGIHEGIIFRTKTGKELHRGNIWKDMKDLCQKANVDSKKVFPHNLRHLFARTFYNMDKDIAKLADILGHSSIETTRIYIMTTGSEHLQKMERMKLTISKKPMHTAPAFI